MKFALPFFIFVSALIAADPADARRGSSTSEGLLFVTQTELTDGTGAPLSLCILTETSSKLFINFSRSAESYVLAPNNCIGQSYYPLPSDALASGKAEGVFPANIPNEPQLTWSQWAAGSWGMSLVVLFFGAIILAFVAEQLRKRKRRSALGNVDPFAERAAVVMGMAAASDGKIDDEELHRIQDIMKRITGTEYSLEAVQAMVKSAGNPANDAEIKKLSQGMGAEHRELLVKAALMVVASDGDISAKESTFVSKVSAVMGIGQTQFNAIVDATYGPAAPAE